MFGALRLRLRFAWQAQYFGSASMPACRFHVASAALCADAFCNFVAGAAFCHVAKVVFWWIAEAGLRKPDTVSKAVAGAAVCELLKRGGSCAKIIFIELCKNSFIRKTRRKSSILNFKMWKVEEVSHEMLRLEASYLKFWRNFVRNSCFRSLLHENWRRSRAKRLFWELVAWKGSLARNRPFHQAGRSCLCFVK